MTTNVSTLIRSLSDSAVKRTDVINAVVARELILTGLNPSGSYKVTAVATATGVDKGDVSRIGKILAGLDVKIQRAIKSLDISVINPDDTSTLASAAALGERFRRVKSTPASEPRPASETKGEDTDASAVLHAWITEEGITDAAFDARVKLVNDIVMAARAERQAAADAA